MDFINIIILVIFVAFLGYEGYNALKSFKEHDTIMKETLAAHPDAKVVKDYFIWIFFYLLLGVFIMGMAYVSYLQQTYLEAILFFLFFLFCFIFVIEMIISKTVIFYESGFMFKLAQHKYRNVVSVGDSKKFLKGFTVKLTGEDPIILSKKAVDELNVYLEAYKKRKQENRDARREARKEGKK